MILFTNEKKNNKNKNLNNKNKYINIIDAIQNVRSRNNVN